MPNIFPNLYAIVEDKLMRVEVNKPQEKGASLLTLKARREQIHHLYTQWSNNEKYAAYLQLLGDFETYFTDAVMLKKEEEDSLRPGSEEGPIEVT
jgi:hypothetical protein